MNHSSDIQHLTFKHTIYTFLFGVVAGRFHLQCVVGIIPVSWCFPDIMTITHSKKIWSVYNHLVVKQKFTV